MNKDHTQGPWKVAVSHDGLISVEASGSRRINLTTAGTPVIADVYAHADAEHFSGLANAMLIAAAPDLFKALAGMIELAEQINDASDEGGQLDYRFDAARAAIEKALGK